MIFSKLVETLRKNRFLTYGLPFLTFVIGSSFAMQHFASIRYIIHKYYHQNVSPELLEKMKESGVKFIGQDSIDEEYQKMKKTLDINNWKNIRGPREFENMSDDYKQQLEMLKEKNKMR